MDEHDLAVLRAVYLAWDITVTEVPGGTLITARRGLVTIYADSAGGLRRQIGEHEAGR